jgi:hypothetical protein
MTDSSFLLPVNASLGGGPHGTASNSSLPFPPSFIGDDMSNIPYPGEYISIPLWELGLKIAFSALISLLALGGNIFVIFIVWRNKKMHTPTNYYIVNLAFSDLMVTLSCTWVHLVDNITEGWILGAFFCKFNSFAQGESLTAGIT